MPVPNRTKKSMAIAFKKFMGSFDLAVKSMTVAHGKEFLGYRAFQKLYGLSVYF
ncbi:IS30 family (Tra8) [Fructobacillus fructosus]|nr:IS30 family (Tra8) [Fructobacillus fructosus]